MSGARGFSSCFSSPFSLLFEKRKQAFLLSLIISKDSTLLFFLLSQLRLLQLYPYPYPPPRNLSFDTIVLMDASGPEAEFFNSERRNLITDIFRAINQYEIRSNLPDGTETLNAAAISALWLSDFTQLELLSKRFRTDASGTLRAMNKAVLATQLVSRCKFASRLLLHYIPKLPQGV